MGYRKAAKMRRRQHVRGHYRTSKSGKRYYVSGHTRNDYGDGCCVVLAVIGATLLSAPFTYGLSAIAIVAIAYGASQLRTRNWL